MSKTMKRSAIHTVIAIVLGLGLVLVLLWLLGDKNPPAVAAPPGCRLQAPGDVITVCLEGTCDYASVQAAVDAASDGAVIKVAQGVYTDVHVRPRADWVTTGVVTQVVYISKTVTIQGSYTTTNWTTPHPLTQPTTLDAQGQGRVMYVTGNISPTIEGLWMTGGDASGLGGSSPYLGDNDVGGGVYVYRATAIVHHNRIFSNTAWHGGGLHLLEVNTGTVSYNAVENNTAQSYGGGLCLEWSTANLTGNTVASNTAVFGGGVKLYWSRAILTGNTIVANTAGDGGGLFAQGGWDTLRANIIAANIAMFGGGLFLVGSSAVLDANVIMSNTASSDGGGLYLVYSVYGPPTLVNNRLVGNQANIAGGGLYVMGAAPVLLHNTIVGNGSGDGSGIYIDGGESYGYGNPILTNNIVVSHTVGITVAEGCTATLNGVLWHGNTINVGGAGTITVTNAITADPAFAADGYHLTPGSAAIDAGVPASVDTDIDGEPRPMGHGYDLGADEFRVALAITKWAVPDPVEAGARLTYTIRVTNTGLVTLHAAITDTLPAHVTPTGDLIWETVITVPGGVWVQAVPVTVEEGYAGLLTNVVQVATAEGATGIYTATTLSLAPHLEVIKYAEPDPVQAGARLTYTIRVTNTGLVTLHAAITDTLPAQVTPTGDLIWEAVITAPGGVWVQTVPVTVGWGYAGPLTNVVEVATSEGATGICTETSQAQVTPALEVTKQAEPVIVQTGGRLTYTIRVTNTGNINLSAVIGDILPAQVTPTGDLIWETVITAPGGVWVQTVPVTVEWGYAGPLTNAVEVKTAEGAWGYVETVVTVDRHSVYLPLVMRQYP